MSLDRLYFCRALRCPGLPWRASERVHPNSCIGIVPNPIALETQRPLVALDANPLEVLDRSVQELTELVTRCEDYRNKLRATVAAMREVAEGEQ